MTPRRGRLRSLFELEQRVTTLDGLAGGDEDLLDDALVLGLDLVLHLHRLEDDEPLAGFDPGTFLD